MTILPLQKSPGDKIAGVYILHFSPPPGGGGEKILAWVEKILYLIGMRY